MDLEQDRILRIGEAIKPLLDELPVLPLHTWHRFSFDIVQNSTGVDVVHVRLVEIPRE